MLHDPIGKRPHRGSREHLRACRQTIVYQETLPLLGIECSMSRTACCYDNAAMERFFWSLKYEWTNRTTYDDLEDA